MQRCGEAERGGFRRHVMHAAIGQEDRAGDSVRRYVRERRAERGEQTRTVGLAVRLSGFDSADFQPGDAAKPLDQRGARGFRLLQAVAEILARTLVDNNRGDGGQRLAILAGEGRVCQREHHQQQRDRAHHRAATTGEKQQPRHNQRNSQAGPYDIGWNQRRKCDAENSWGSYCPSRSSNAGT